MSSPQLSILHFKIPYVRFWTSCKQKGSCMVFFVSRNTQPIQATNTGKLSSAIAPSDLRWFLGAPWSSWVALRPPAPAEVMRRGGSWSGVEPRSWHGSVFFFLLPCFGVCAWRACVGFRSLDALKIATEKEKNATCSWGGVADQYSLVLFHPRIWSMEGKL